MDTKVYIKSELLDQLQQLDCYCTESYINVTRIEDNKVYFTYGRCKLHVTKEEFENYKQ
jgi:hypothetical protein